MELPRWQVTRTRMALFFTVQLVITLATGILKWLAHTQNSVFWPVIGIGLAALVTAKPQHLRRLAAVHGLAVTTGLLIRLQDVDTAITYGVANSVEVLFSACLYLRLTRGNIRISGGANLARLLVVSVAGSVLFALLTAFNLAFIIQPTPDNITQSAIAVLFGHLGGSAVVAPLFLMERHRHITPGQIMEGVVQVLTLIAVVGYVFKHEANAPLDFLPFAALAWAALRLSPMLTAAELTGTALVVTVATLRGWGPFADYGRDAHNPLQASQLAVIYHLTLLGTILALALIVNRVRESAIRLSSSEELYRRTFDEAMLGMVMLDRTAPRGGSVISRVNPVASRLLACDPKEAIGTGLLSHLSPDHHSEVHRVLDDVFAGKLETWTGRVALHNESTDQLHVLVTLSPLRDEDGTVNRIAVQMADVTEAQLATERLEDLALHDPLTGLANRTLLEDRLQQWLEIGGREGTQVLLLYIDLDDFKHVNDTAGHETGDLLLLEVSRRLMETLRPQDTVARLGGDEFVVVTPLLIGDVTEASSVISARLLSALSAPYRLNGQTYSVGASIGMTLSRPSSTTTSLMREADAAMYEAKRQGKNCRHMFEDDANDAVSDRVILLNELNEAFTKDQFELHIQPMIDLPTGAVVGGEALIRWRHPERGLLPPAAWLEVAEESDMVHRLGAWVINEACRQAARWQEIMGAESPIIHANVSAKQLGNGTLLDDVRGALTESGLSPDKLVLELTETQLERSEQAVKADFDGLRAQGIQIAADDFGTGYSSLTRLTDMPIDILKIDRTFVARMSEDKRARAVVAALVTMGSAIGMEVVAEGVETIDEASHLRDLGCGQGQGFLWSRPIPPDEFLEVAQQRVAVMEPAIRLIPRPHDGTSKPLPTRRPTTTSETTSSGDGSVTQIRLA